MVGLAAMCLAGTAWAAEVQAPAGGEAVQTGTVAEEIETGEVSVEEPSVAPAENETQPSVGEVVEEQPPKTWAVLIGFLQGGGSMLGVDLEVLAVDRWAIQAGAGYAGFGAAINFHFEPTLDSNYLSLGYWHQGFEEDLSQQAVGLTYGFRSFDWLTAQIGLGYVTYRGETAVKNLESAFNTEDLPKFMLLYSIGAYF